jgi:hypothetical protein
LFRSFSYLVCRCLLQLVVLGRRSEAFKELEIVVLRHELSVLRRQAWRPQLMMADRVLLAAASRLLPRPNWRSFVVTPATHCCAGTGGSSPAAGPTAVGAATVPIGTMALVSEYWRTRE